MAFKDIYLEFWGSFCWQSGTFSASLVEGVMRNLSVKLF